MNVDALGLTGNTNILTRKQSMTLPITTDAVLQFLSNWQTIQHGQIGAGVKLVIEYDIERLPRARRWFRGALFGELEVYVKFHPGGRVYTGSVVKKVRSGSEGGRGMVMGLEPAAYEVVIPADAVQVEIWFRGFYQTNEHYEAWDSRYGQNYWFPVADGRQLKPAMGVTKPKGDAD